MKKFVCLLTLFLMISLTMSAQARGGQITRKKANTTTTTAAPKKTKSAPKKTTPAAKTHSSGKPRSATTGISQAQEDPIIQNLINNMVYVQGGTFTMGATSEQGSDAQLDEKPAHQVTLSSFSIGRYEVTQEEWQAVMGNNPSYFKGAKRPVESVSWNDCQEFIRKLNAMTGKREGWFKTIKRRNSYTYALGQTYNTDRVRFFRMFDAYEVMTMMVTFSLYCICRVMMNPFLELYTAGVNDISYVVL